MSQHLSSVGEAYERGFAIKDKSDTESEWYTNVSRCNDRHCFMVRSLRGPALRATDSCLLKTVQVTEHPDSAMAALGNISCNRCWIIDDDCLQDVVQPVTASLKLSWTVTSPVGDAGRGEAAVREVTAIRRRVESLGFYQEGMGA
ncbi:hypothetical protein ALC62_10353 [Cyphomyrmex costatus]|uniref:Uncharacterized protein n=1 Tax=Cyphomyrmex costatus TaxID=456900 RepID=A0A151IEE2_9HYME|nr:hypothetical protein ALC62_10353 [Cyphomyrmex costatus]